MFENFQEFMQNPIKCFSDAKYNIPNGMTNGNDILQHLLVTGQITQDQYNIAYQKFKFFETNGMLPKMNW